MQFDKTSMTAQCSTQSYGTYNPCPSCLNLPGTDDNFGCASSPVWQSPQTQKQDQCGNWPSTQTAGAVACPHHIAPELNHQGGVPGKNQWPSYGYYVGSSTGTRNPAIRIKYEDQRCGKSYLPALMCSNMGSSVNPGVASTHTYLPVSYVNYSSL